MKRLLVYSILTLCVLAAGIGIGAALPHMLDNRPTGNNRSEFFQRLAADTAPDPTGNTCRGVLAARLRKKFTVQVVRSAPEVMIGSDGPYANGDPLNFTVLILNRGMGHIDSQALLGDLEAYLKELAGAGNSEGVKTTTEDLALGAKNVTVQWLRFGKNEISTYDREVDGKKAGFAFRYKSPEGYGEMNVDLYSDRDLSRIVAVSMDLRER
jgi:hypothetical protein